MEKIPINKYGWIDYKGEAFILECNPHDGFERGVVIQCDGTSCKSIHVIASLYARFVPTCKYLKTNTWLRRTHWSQYDQSIYFRNSKRKLAIEKNTNDLIKYNKAQYKQIWQDTFDEATKNSISCEYILKAILKEVKKKTGLDFELDFDDYSYNQEWSEAYVPLKKDGKHYLLTWENCD